MFFWFFLGQYSIFALFALKRLFFLDSTALWRPGTAKTPYCPKKTNVFKPKRAKMLALSQKKQKNQSLETSRPWRSPSSPNFGFFGFFGTVQHFCTFCFKKIGFFGTVQHLGGLGLQKSRTVPKKPMFLSQNEQKCCTVPKKPKKPKFGDLQALEEPKLSKLMFFWFFWDSTAFLHFLL